MGLDRFMVLKFLRMGMVTFSIYSLFAIPILFPINIINQRQLEGLNYLTMANVVDDVRTWAHCLLAVTLSGKEIFRFTGRLHVNDIMVTHTH